MTRYILSLLLLVSVMASGQKADLVKEKHFGIGMVPQYSIINGTRIDFDYRLPSKNQWLVVAPQLYIAGRNSSLWDFNEMAGAGIEIQHRLFLGEKSEPKGAYFAYGPVFQFYSVKDDGLASYTFQENQVTYIGLEENTISTLIYKFGGNLIFGYQALISKTLYLDFYLGTGARFSFDNRKSGLHSYYNDWWGDMGYSGTLMVGGMRIGIYF